MEYKSFLFFDVIGLTPYSRGICISRVAFTFFVSISRFLLSYRDPPVRKEPRKMYGRCYSPPNVPRVWFGHVRVIVLTDISMLVMHLG